MSTLFFGDAYIRGHGVPQDYVQAHLWVNLAASRLPSGQRRDEDEAVRLRNFLTARMTPAQLTLAQELARAWQPKPETTGKPPVPAVQSALPLQPAQPLPSPATVQTVQRLLTALGYNPGPVDGIYGPQTRAALQAFQHRVGLPLSDELTPELVDHLTVAVAGVRTTPRSPAQRP
jgi:peptidoglycan hydrolase-like protein with peptidoglycan-binding domain